MDSQYRHGGDVYRAGRSLNISLQTIYDFSANINPLGPSPQAITAIKENMDLIRHYPDPHCIDLRQALADHFDLAADHIVLGNGAAELIYLLAQVLRPKQAVVHAPTFIEYAEAVSSVGGTLKEVILEPTNQFALSWTCLKKALPGTDLLFICNPNNPTGRLEKKSDLQLILDYALEKDITVVVDEAFMDFIDGREQYSVVPLLRHYTNLVVIYSMTKFFGIPGLRLGVLLAAPSYIKQINNSKDPWNVNTLAQVAGVASLADHDYIQKTKRLIEKERTFLSAAISKLPGLKVYPGAANYLLLEIKNKDLTSSQLAAKTATQGVLIRDCATFNGLGTSFIRVAVKTREENMVLLKALKAALA